MENQPLIQKPRSICTLLKLTLSLFKRFFLPIFCIIAAIHITSFISIQLIKPAFWFSKILGIICYLGCIAIYTIGAVAIYKISVQACSGSATDCDDVRKTVKENFWRYIGTFLLVGIVCSLAFLPSILPFVMISLFPSMGFPFMVICKILSLALAILPLIFCFYAALIFPVMFAEKLSCDASWIKSKDLMKGNRLRLILASLLLGLLNVVVYIVPVVAIVFFETDIKSISWIFEVLKSFSIFFSMIFTTVFYFDVRGRKELKNVVAENAEIEILI